MKANRARDERAVLLATQLGWTPIRIWECQIKQDVVSAVELIKAACQAS